MNCRIIRLNFFLFTFIFFTFCSSRRDSIETGEKVPSFETKDAAGDLFSLKDIKGKRALIHFWADWCAECRAEFPRLEEAYQKYKDDNFIIIAVNVGQTKDHVQSFKDEFNLTFPMLLDENSKIAEKFGLRGLPTNYFIDEDAVITKVIIGWVDAKQINQFINN